MIGKVEKIFKAPGDRSRPGTISMPGEKSLCVCEIKEVLDFSQSTVSYIGISGYR